MSNSLQGLVKTILATPSKSSLLPPLINQLNQIITSEFAQKLDTPRTPSIIAPSTSLLRNVEAITSKALSSSGLSSNEINDDDSTFSPQQPTDKVYGETPLSTLTTLLSLLPSPLPSTFVDVGSGSGVLSLTAALTGNFASVVGLEYSSLLYSRSTSLLPHYLKLSLPTSLSFQNLDVRERNGRMGGMGVGTNLFFCNCPTWSPAMMKDVATHLDATSKPGDVLVTLSRRAPCTTYDITDVFRSHALTLLPHLPALASKLLKLPPLVYLPLMASLSVPPSLARSLLLDLGPMVGGGGAAKPLGVVPPLLPVLVSHLSYPDLKVRALASTVLRALAEHPVFGSELRPHVKEVTGRVEEAMKGRHKGEEEHVVVTANLVDLLSVLPLQSAKLLPKPYAELMLQDESPIADFYLKEFGFKIKRGLGKKKAFRADTGANI
ncbi:hypothetical protein TrCOL_g12367 [Triparma columacea]|uniref:Uncharacterized protein n=1 Tax=Triparma columacea TaxID=722753 RepID=A0A9W7L4H5_9STRA|nr:hypothetical protein TrCOL_g12367 [Triparma columacea]